MPRAVRIVYWLAAALAAYLFGTTLAVAPTYGYHYDVATIARIEVHEFDDATAGTARLDEVREGSVSPSVEARGASTTPTRSLNATNTAKGLGDDFTRALDDIDNGMPRPNVRNPKSFANDGRGGTTRLPDADGAGNPVSYVEHTVNPRPPGGSLDGSRIVVGSDGTVWATTDHFGTWTQVR